MHILYLINVSSFIATEPIESQTFKPKPHFFWTFCRFSIWRWAKLALIYSKRHLQHDSMPFFPLASRFTTYICMGMHRNHNFETYVSNLNRLFFFICWCLSFSSFSYLFAAVIDLLLGLLPVRKILRNRH